MLVFFCSPHANGATDRLAEAALAGATAAGAKPRAIILRQYAYAPCLGCQSCKSGPCVLARDGADYLFELLSEAERALFVAPIYFYALPGQFKVFIDRSQKFWGPDRPGHPGHAKKAGILLASGRRRGAKLFAGALLTLKWFLMPFAYEIAATRFVRGLDFEPPDLASAFELGRQLAHWGREC